MAICFCVSMNDKQKNILDEYRRYLVLKGIKTANDYVQRVSWFFEYVTSINREFDTVSKNIGDEYRTFLVTGDCKLSKGTVNNRLNSIASFYRFLVKKGFYTSNPFKRTARIKTGKTLPKNILSVDDMGILLENFSIFTRSDIMLKCLVEILYGSGVRISEAVSLKLADIDCDNGTLVISESKNGGKKRKVIIGEVGIRWVKKYIAKTGGTMGITGEFLFPQKGKTTIRCLLNVKLRKECQRLGLKVITAHGFRHSIATHILRSGAGIREVQAFLGHARITSTEMYTRIVKDDLKNVIHKHHPREVLDVESD